MCLSAERRLLCFLVWPCGAAWLRASALVSWFGPVSWPSFVVLQCKLLVGFSFSVLLWFLLLLCMWNVVSVYYFVECHQGGRCCKMMCCFPV